jgi:hypothetical protein
MRTADVFLGAIVAAVASFAAACAREAPPSQPPFVGKIWLSTDASAPPGSLRIFLPDGTLVMVSCVETYRLARWTSIDDDTIFWQEDTARIDAEIGLVTANELTLRLRLVNESVEQRYRLAEVLYVCPDLRP